jgi:hypothetical protein
MWDTWVHWHESKYYLYYLAKSAAAGAGHDNISLALSDNGVRWNEVGPIIKKDNDATSMGTGSLWKAPETYHGARFLMNYSEKREGRQAIFFAESDDLVHWRKLGRATAFTQDERWYEPEARWDCIWTIPRSEGGLYGYWTATPKEGINGVFGFGQSLDGVRWEALAPPELERLSRKRVPRTCEVGAVEKIQSRYYLLLGMHGAAGPVDAYVAKDPEGPFCVAEKNRTLLAAQTYFPRFIQTPHGLLICHHSIASDGTVYLGLLKRAIVADDGTLRLGWWNGNDRLKRDRMPLDVQLPSATGIWVQMLDPMDMTRGLIVEGAIALPVNPFAPRRGLYIEHEKGMGTGVLFDAQGRAELALMREDGAGCSVLFHVDREKTFDSPARWRLLLDGRLAELYLDDILIEAFSLPSEATGRIGLIDGGDANAVSDLNAWC